jgi:hypothetical protein
MSKCARCTQTPQGIEGHIDLFACSMGGNRMQFRCATCGCMWSRRYSGDGGFQWSEPKKQDLPGMDMPGRRHPSLG